ncbi:MAG: DUF4142 domain-containing protein [Sphingobacteriaceae bacterium]|nr:MAG: DUF4142 domain-containing protein [Sphingobacteriaceae bacterium]
MKYCFYGLFFSVMLIQISCSNNQQNKSATESTTKKQLDTADLHLANDLSVFFTNQVQSAKLVEIKSTNKTVVDLAKQNEQLYTNMGNRLNSLSDEYNIQLPAKMSATADKNLVSLRVTKLARLDHAYLLQMLKDHNITIREINAAKNIQCLPLKAIVISNEAAIIKQAYALSALKDATP